MIRMPPSIRYQCEGITQHGDRNFSSPEKTRKLTSHADINLLFREYYYFKEDKQISKVEATFEKNKTHIRVFLENNDSHYTFTFIDCQRFEFRHIVNSVAQVIVEFEFPLPPQDSSCTCKIKVDNKKLDDDIQISSASDIKTSLSSITNNIPIKKVSSIFAEFNAQSIQLVVDYMDCQRIELEFTNCGSENYLQILNKINDYIKTATFPPIFYKKEDRVKEPIKKTRACVLV